MRVQKISEKNEICTFMVGDAVCGIDLLKISEINKNFEITSVPQSKEHIKGIINLRGKIVSILDLGKKLGLKDTQIDEKSRNIIVNSKNEDIGFVVERICDVVSAQQSLIEAPPSNLGKISGIHFTGVLKTENRLIGILDIESLL